MSRICQITGKRAMVGNNVSHSNSKTKRKFNPNLQQKRFYIPEEKKWITLKVSTSGLKVINKRGIYACLKEARAKGFIYDKPKAAPAPVRAAAVPAKAKTTIAPVRAKVTPVKSK